MKNQPQPMSKVGFWNDAFSEKYIWPQEIEGLGKTDSRIIGYLKGGHVAGRYMGYSACRICGKQLGSCDMTDGMFLWPQGMEHYVEDHGILLPDALLAFAEEQGWESKRPEWLVEHDDQEGWRPVEYVDGNWRQWCNEHRDYDKIPSFPIVEPPKATGDGQLTGDNICDLFVTIEYLDFTVDRVDVPSVEMFDRIQLMAFGKDLGSMRKTSIDEFDGKAMLWTSTLVTGKQLIKAYSGSSPDGYFFRSALAFVDGKPVIFCERQESMFTSTRCEKAYCPDLGLEEDEARLEKEN